MTIFHILRPGDIQIHLENPASIARTIPFPWNKIRIALRVHHQRDTGGSLGTMMGQIQQLAVGVCSGTANGLFDLGSPMPHWVGAINVANPVRSTADSYVRYQWPVVVAKIVDGTLSSGSTITASPHLQIGTTGTVRGERRLIYAVEITKGSPNYSVNTYTNNTTSAIISPTDITANVFYQDVETKSDLSVAQHVYGTAQTIAVDEGTDGTLDSVCIAIKNELGLFISDVMLVKLA